MASDAFKMIDFLNGQLEQHLSEASDVEMGSGSEQDSASEQGGDQQEAEEVINSDDGEEGMAVGLVPRAGPTSPNPDKAAHATSRRSMACTSPPAVMAAGANTPPTSDSGE